MNFGELKIKITHPIRINQPLHEVISFGWGIVQNSIEKQIVDVIGPIDSLILEETVNDEFF
jgi:hypothetical protein